MEGAGRAAILSAMVVLRGAVAGDAAVVARIYIDSWNQGFGHLMGTRELTSDLVSRWEKDLTDVRVEWVIAEIDDEVVGFAGIGPSRDPIDPVLGELDSIAVDPTRWRQGVGRSLMKHALTRLRAQYSRAIVWTVADYERGHGLYLAAGWKPLDQSRANGTQVAFGHALK
jgi:ribosomal protein S18 acetylase RimI-like enzyme